MIGPFKINIEITIFAYLQGESALKFPDEQTFDLHQGECHILPLSFFRWLNSCEYSLFRSPMNEEKNRHKLLFKRAKLARLKSNL